jgi:uncharacterized protein (TIGR03067 family)
MHRIFFVLALLVFPATLIADDDVKKELKALQGKWKAVALEAGGNSLPKASIPEFTYIVGADGKATGKMAQAEYTAAMIINPKADPKTIDNVHETGTQKGRKQYGIYKLDGDKWTVCMTPPGAPEGSRPKDFNTKGSGNVVFIFARIKEEK